jgi:hypothetical protein
MNKGFSDQVPTFNCYNLNKATQGSNTFVVCIGTQISPQGTILQVITSVVSKTVLHQVHSIVNTMLLWFETVDNPCTNNIC